MLDNYTQMSWLRKAGFALVFVFGLASIIATGGDDDDDDNGGGGGSPQQTATINGSVTGSGGLAEVEVSAGGRSTATDLNGYYELTDVPVPGDGLLVLTYEKEGYATFQRTIPVTADETHSVTARLLQFHYSEQVVADDEQNLDVENPGDPGGDPFAQLSFPAGSLGSGNVTINVAVGDPTTEEGRPTFPGDYMAATTQGSDADTPLESVVFTEITIHDANGDEITEVTEPVTVTLRLPDSLQSRYVAGETIEWWSYDEIDAIWIREDADPATPEMLDDAMVIDQGGVLYAQAKVTHFTWWNVDEPIDEHSCLCAIVVDDNDLPVAGAQLIAEGITYNGRSQPTATGVDGKGCVTVKRSTDTVTEQIRLFVEQGSVQFPYNVTDPVEGDVDTHGIFTPTIEGSTVANTGQCVDLGNNIALSYDGRITGRVTFEGTSVPVAGFVINSDFGATATTDSDGNYEINVPLDLPVTLFAVGQAATTVTVEDADTPVVANFEVANRDPVIDSLSRNPEGTVTNSQAVNLTATASDDDGDPITYSWSADQGSFNMTTGPSVTWTAPAAGAGTATLTLTVADDKGGETTQNIAIVYAGATPSGDSLSFVFKDNIRNDQAVADVVVALYNTDNTTIARTLTSGADGVVDFGDVGHSRATFTIAYESDEGLGDRYIETFMEMQVADNIVYYTEGDDFDIDLFSGTQIATVNYSFSDVPANAGATAVQPNGFGSIDLSTDPGPLVDQSVLDSFLQDDGQMSMLALSFSAINPLILNSYGFLLDQTIVDGSTYDFTLNRTPVTTGWTTQPATDLYSVTVSGFRRGIWYGLGGESIFSNPSIGDSGSLLVPTEFPVDYYWVFASVEGDSSGVDITKRYDTLPQSVEVPIPDYSFSDVVFNDANGTLSWTLSGTTSRDLAEVYIEAFEQELPIEWTIVMAPDATSWQLMELPAPANTWIDTATLDNVIDVGVEVVDFDFLSGIDDTWQFFISGGSFLQTATQILTGWADVPDQEASLSVRSLTATDEGVANSQREQGSVLPRGLSKLRRQ